MPQQITIPCELIITPASQSTQHRIELNVMGETVLNEYERDLSPGAKDIVAKICLANSRLIGKYGQSLSREVDNAD